MENGGRIKLGPFGLNRYFPVGGFCTTIVERYQVLQEGIERARNHYKINFTPDQVIVIGDTLKDIEAARKIGARVIAVATGGNTYEELLAKEPDLLLANFTNDRLFFSLLD
ncbi:HAD hydrolase-like protein [Effusibacillus consociatus]|uniref:HAD hydrolase-like protein n=1 Tax=Effusibacillus consociatus TaxID=1117041 RepID=A0ABV9Q695_9BACL